jgi:hypothetical protein
MDEEGVSALNKYCVRDYLLYIQHSDDTKNDWRERHASSRVVKSIVDMFLTQNMFNSRYFNFDIKKTKQFELS